MELDLHKVLETPRLYLTRLTEEEHFEDLCKLHADPEVVHYIRPPQTPDEVRETMIRVRKGQEDNPDFGLYALYEKSSDEFIGWFLFKKLDNTEELEIGYRMHKKFWGKGYATEMGIVFRDYLTQKLGYKNLAAVTHLENEGSKNVLKKLGFKFIDTRNLYETTVTYFRYDS